MKEEEVRTMRGQFKSDGLLLPVADTGRMVKVEGWLGGMIIRANRPSDIGRVDPLKVWGDKNLNTLQLHTDHNGGYYGEAHTPDEGEWRELLTYLKSQGPLLTGGGYLFIYQNQSQTSRWDPLLVVLPGVLTHLMSCGMRFVWLYGGSVRGNAIMRMMDDIKEGGWRVRSGGNGAIIYKPGEGGGEMDIRLGFMTITGSKSDLDQLKALNDQIDILYDPTWRETDDFDTPPPGKQVRDRSQIDAKLEEAFRKALEGGITKTCRGRMLLLGRAGVGKTSVKNALLGFDFSETHNITDMIHINHAMIDDDGTWNALDEEEMRNFDEHFLVAQAMMERKKEESLKEPAGPKIEMEGQSRKDSAASFVRHGEKAEAQLAQEKKDDPAAISSQHEMMVHEKMSSEVEALVKDDKDLEKKHTLHLWDFAGQLVFYTVHQLFLTDKTILLLVCDASNPLHETVPQEFREPYDARLNNNRPWTEQEYLEYFLRAANIWIESEMEDSDGSKPWKPPHLFTICNKADLLTRQEMDRYIKSVKTLVKKTPAFRHMVRDVIPFSSNPRPENREKLQHVTYEESCSRLKRSIMKVIPHFLDELPIKWLRIRNRLQEHKHRTFSDAVHIARQFQVKEDEVKSVLQYFHKHRELVYFDAEACKDFIVCQPNWLIAEMKKVITIEENQKYENESTPELTNLHDKLFEEKVLNEELAKVLWESECTKILEIMQKYLLLLPWQKDEYGRNQYLVPCLLEAMNEFDHTDHDFTIPPVHFFLEKKVMPIGLTSRLVTYLTIQKGWMDAGGELPDISFNGARFFLNEQETHIDISVQEKVWQPHGSELTRCEGQIVIEAKAIVKSPMSKKAMVDVPLCLNKARTSIEEGIRTILSMINVTQHVQCAAESDCLHKLQLLDGRKETDSCKECRKVGSLKKYACWFGKELIIPMEAGPNPPKVRLPLQLKLTQKDMIKAHDFVRDGEELLRGEEDVEPDLLKCIEVNSELISQLKSYHDLPRDVEQKLKLQNQINDDKVAILMDHIMKHGKGRFLPLLLSLEATDQEGVINKLDTSIIRSSLKLQKPDASLLENVKSIKRDLLE